jgi:hypothetical protein
MMMTDVTKTQDECESTPAKMGWDGGWEFAQLTEDAEKKMCRNEVQISYFSRVKSGIADRLAPERFETGRVENRGSATM